MPAPCAVRRLCSRCDRGLALDQLKRNGFQTYLPRVRERRVVRRRVIEAVAPLFPSYCFVVVESQWHRARWSPGVANLIMDGSVPGRVANSVITELRGREINGLKVGGVKRGPFAGLGGLYAGQAPAERVLVLLSLFGAARRVALPAADVVAMRR